MCGRFTITIEAAELQKSLSIGDFPADWTRRYNVAPTQPVGVVIDPQDRAVAWMRWGLVPSWAKDASIASQLINARSETIAEKPSFRRAFAQRRCLILADGFYEWQKTPGASGKKQPYYFRRLEGKPFAFAGLWERWISPAKEELLTCTIITCPANELVGQVHDRMPVMLDGERLWGWLKASSESELKSYLSPYPAEQMQNYPVSRLVNRSDQDVPELIQPAVAQE